jgi:hypothetical protein
VQFNPKLIQFAATYVGNTFSPIVTFLINVAVASTIVTVYSVRTAAGEEIGWRGYMLTRLIDAGVPRPILASGIIWGLWHVPLILGGVYLVGPPPIVAALLWMVTATAFSFVFARLRLETGTVWPAIMLHSAWNAIIQSAFDPASKGTGAELWIGESGILVALTMIVAAVVFSCGRWTIHTGRGEQQETGAARAGLKQSVALSIATVLVFALAIPARGTEASVTPNLTSHASLLPRGLQG